MTVAEVDDFVTIEAVTVYDAVCVCGWRAKLVTEAAARNEGDWHARLTHGAENPAGPLRLV